MTDADTYAQACDLAACPVPRARCGFANNGLPCRHPSWRDAWQRAVQHLQADEEQLAEVCEHVANEHRQKAAYADHHTVL